MLNNDSCSVNADGLLTVAQALARIKSRLRPLECSETIDLKQAFGRILACSVHSNVNIPHDRNAAMDGYAFASTDAPPAQAFSLTLVGTAWAGRPFTEPLQAGQCVRIFTGAVLPQNADSVVMQELVTLAEDKVCFPAHCRLQQNIREVGEEIKQHALLLAAPKLLTAADLGLLAAAGVCEVEVKCKLRIGFFSTGDELVNLGQPLRSGQIYDSNRYSLQGLLNDPCFSVHDMGVIPDNAGLLEHNLTIAATKLDVMLTTGGASVGAADYVAEVLNRCGKVSFWKVAMKPGKPLLFGHIEECLFFGLPGNPVAVMITFDKFVKPALQKLCGYPELKSLQIQATCLTALKKSAGRQEYQRGILQQDEQGQFTVQSVGKQGSHLLTSMSKANCYIVLASDCAGVEVGALVTVEPFSAVI